nr:endolytic transglycosylase MltG [candidate division Zixibacteria bacterium]
MNSPDRKKVKTGLHEYFLYWLVTIILFILALPVLIFKTGVFLVGATGAPLKSIKNLLGFVLVLAVLAAGFTAFEIFYPYDIGAERRSITIEEHDSFVHVLNQLQDNGIIKGTFIFKTAAVISGVDKVLAPGRYDFAGKISQYAVLKKLKHRDIATVMVTIPEGLTVYKTAGILSRNLGIDSAIFVGLCFDTADTRDKYGTDGLEGYLFPETYRLWYGIKPEDIIAVMVAEFNRQTAGLFDNPPEKLASKNQITTLASIIEAEAVLDEEKTKISSVYHNRLRIGMLLQADPTVIYALGGLDRPLYYADLKYDSPYNTYKYKGLPPGPINSPGLAAIRAALNPEQTDFLYFVADGSGGHVFSTTLNEHNRAKYRIKKARKSGNKST